MVVNKPPTSNSLGNQVLAILTEPPVDPTKPTLAELNAGLFAQCHTYGQYSLAPEQATGAAPSKTCSKDQDTALGRVTWPMIDLPYSYKPQETATPGAPGNELFEALTPGAEVFAYFADDLDGEETSAFEVGDVINLGFRTRVGERRRAPSGDDEYAQFQTTQGLAPQGGKICEDYKITA